MCSHFGIVSSLPAIKEKYGKPLKGISKNFNNYIVRVGDSVPVITGRDSELIQMFQFGFTPLKSPQQLSIPSMSIHRMLTKPEFQESVSNQRCLIPATHFIVRGSKGSYCVHLNKNRPFFLAGVWETWINPINRDEVKGFAIVTCKANKILLAEDMETMPVILFPDTTYKWLRSYERLKDLSVYCRPIAESLMDIYPISSRYLKDVESNEVALLKPIGKSYWQTIEDKETKEKEAKEAKRIEELKRKEEAESKALMKHYKSVNERLGK